MGLRFEDRWIWDFWLAREGSRFHIFYLQAPRSLRDPNLRHAHATVGHAVSEDLVEWEVLPDALRPGAPSSWDDQAIWTGSVVEHGDEWHMFYTGVSLRNGVLSQEIGSAVSRDLVTWEKTSGPLIVADPRWYETHENHRWYEEAWRDPWVFRGSDGRFHALITARANHGEPSGRGVIGHAWSNDLTTWEVTPPLSEPGEFGHLEVPQLTRLGGSHFLVFSCQYERVSAGRRSRHTEVGDATYVLPTSSELGPYEITDARPGLPEDLYSGRIIRNATGASVWLAFRNTGPDGSFLGELTDPIPVGERPNPWLQVS